MLLLLLLVLATGARAQTFAEWFRQRETQEAYLLEQLVALRVYRGHTLAGYAYTGLGLEVIGGHQGGEYERHREHFGALDRVSPAVRRYGKVAAILDAQVRLQAEAARTGELLRATGTLSAGEEAYVQRVFARMLEAGTLALGELQDLTTDGTLTLTDAGRLGRIDRIHAETEALFLLARRFGAEARQLAAARVRVLREARNSRLLQGLERGQEP